SSATFTNQGTFNAQANASFNAPFTNQSGAFLNRTGAGSTSGFGSTFTSAGPVNVNSGTLDFNGTSSNVVTVSGNVTIAANAVFQVGATTNLFTFDAASAVSGAGTFNYTGST